MQHKSSTAVKFLSSLITYCCKFYFYFWYLLTIAKMHCKLRVTNMRYVFSFVSGKEEWYCWKYRLLPSFIFFLGCFSSFWLFGCCECLGGCWVGAELSPACWRSLVRAQKQNGELSTITLYLKKSSDYWHNNRQFASKIFFLIQQWRRKKRRKSYFFGYVLQ